MKKNLNHYTSLAVMFRYPAEDFTKNFGNWRNIIFEYDNVLNMYLDPFISHIENNSQEYQEEYFVNTFYVQPLCCLDIGYVLFGEDYRRGQFMANLAMEHRKAGNDCGTELPDHLPCLMTLIPKIQDAELSEELVFSIMTPAVDEMITGFGKNENHYKGLLKLVKKIMEMDFSGSKYEQFRVTKNVKKENSSFEKTLPD